MNRVLSVFGVRFTTGHALWAAVLIPACLLLFARMNLMWLGITLAVLIALGAVLTVRGRRVTGWVGSAFRRGDAATASPRPRRRNPRSGPPSSPATTSRCGGRATRWCRSSNSCLDPSRRR